MNANLIAVIDETGTTSRPDLSVASDFGVGVVIFRSGERQLLVDAANKISQIVGSHDFKYRHVQKNTEARRIFLDAINSLTIPSGVFGFYSAGKSLLNEKDRAVVEMDHFGTDDGGETARIAEQIRSGDSEAHFASFLEYLASCLITYTGGWETKLSVHWDQRSDLAAVYNICEQHALNFHSHPTLGDATKIVSFSNVAEGDLLAVSRIAGVLAGDVRFFFRKHGNRIWQQLVDKVRFSGKPDVKILEADTFIEATTVARMSEHLADEDFAVGSKDTCMIGGYCRKFIANLLTFAAPTGAMGHLLIHNENRWDITQQPD